MMLWQIACVDFVVCALLRKFGVFRVSIASTDAIVLCDTAFVDAHNFGRQTE